MLYKRGDVWWLKWKSGGVYHYQSTDRRDRREAEKEARRLRVEADKAEKPEGRKPGRPCGLTLEKLEALDLARVEDEGLGERRTDTIEGLWRPLMRLLGDRRDSSRLTIGDVTAYVGARRKEGVKGQTVKREVEALIRTMRIAKRDGLLRALPFDPEDLPKIRFDAPLKSQRGKVWRLDQIKACFSAINPKAIKAGHLDRCRLILLTGLRLEELHRLQPSWVVPTMPGSAVKALLHVPAEAAKWGKARTIPLVDEAKEIIERCAPFARAKPNKSLKLACEKAKLEGVVTPRDLRTMFLTYAGASDPVAAQVLGGHTNIATTGLYLRSSEERAIDATVSAAQKLGGVVTIGVVTVAKPPRQKKRNRQ